MGKDIEKAYAHAEEWDTKVGMYRAGSREHEDAIRLRDGWLARACSLELQAQEATHDQR